MKKRAFGVLLVIAILAMMLTACANKAGTTAGGDANGEAAKPSNSGGPGEAVNLTGNAAAGEEVFKANCAACHGEEGKGGVVNAGSTDGTVPELNPIDSTMVSSDAKTFATNIDLFVEHGSTPEGDSPALKMLPFGDQKLLTSQQIADVIAYVISLNQK